MSLVLTEKRFSALWCDIIQSESLWAAAESEFFPLWVCPAAVISSALQFESSVTQREMRSETPYSDVALLWFQGPRPLLSLLSQNIKTELLRRIPFFSLLPTRVRVFCFYFRRRASDFFVLSVLNFTTHFGPNLCWRSGLHQPANRYIAAWNDAVVKSTWWLLHRSRARATHKVFAS